MKISYSWLKEYVNISLAPDKLAHLLTMAGLSVESVKRFGDDYVFEIEITANRPDWLSVIGVAREIAALTGEKLKAPKVANIKAGSSVAGLKVRIEERSLCPRYTARVIRNVKVGESPAWLRARIEAMGLRSVNNIVDITNFCLFETGEPMHAFDFDKISLGEIFIRKALEGEKVVSIEGTEKTLDKSMLVIADGKKTIAIAGVMGAANTEVTGATKNILLEAAYFDPVSVRRTSRKLAISTESSYRFERRVDPDNIVCSSNRALEIIIKIVGGEPGPLIDMGNKETKKNAINLRIEKVNKLLGTEISASIMKKIVLALGIKIKGSSGKKMALEAPSFRCDIKNEIDVIEEIARVYGYDKIPITLPKIVEQPTRFDRTMVVRKKIRECLTALGSDEIITYSLLSRKMVEASEASGDSIVGIANPLTNEQEMMRPNLLSGMMNAILWNINRKTKDLKLFEIGNVYFKKDEKYGERMHLAIGITGENAVGWVRGSSGANFFGLKGMIETLFMELGIEAPEFKCARKNGFLSGECAEISIATESVGMMGRISGKVLHNFDIKENVYMVEINLDTLLKYVKLEKRFVELSRYPSVFRDISILAEKGLPNAELVSAAKIAGGSILRDIRLIDRYEGKQIPEGRQSLTYRLEYCDPSKTLEEKDVLDIHGRVLGELEAKFGAKLR